MSMAVTLHSTRFGRLEVPADAVIEFPNGLIGLTGTRYALLAKADDSAFVWLHSLDDPELAIPVTNPWRFFGDFEVELSDNEAARIGVRHRPRRRGARGLPREPARPDPDRERARPPDHQRGAGRPDAGPAVRGPGDGGCLMLIITRRPGEKIMLGDDVVVEVIEVSGSNVRIGIAAPKSVPVYREEIWTAVKEENAAAAATPSDVTLPNPTPTPQ
jgi:carbon storage regulator CsrA